MNITPSYVNGRRIRSREDVDKFVQYMITSNNSVQWNSQGFTRYTTYKASPLHAEDQTIFIVKVTKHVASKETTSTENWSMAKLKGKLWNERRQL